MVESWGWSTEALKTADDTDSFSEISPLSVISDSVAQAKNSRRSLV